MTRSPSNFGPKDNRWKSRVRRYCLSERCMCGNVQAVNACTKVGCEWWGDRHGPMQMDIALATGKMWMHCAEAVIKNLMQSNGKHAVFWSDVRIAIEARAGKGHKNWYGKAAQLMKKYGWNKAPDIKRPSPIASCNGHEEYAYVKEAA